MSRPQGPVRPARPRRRAAVLAGAVSVAGVAALPAAAQTAQAPPGVVCATPPAYGNQYGPGGLPPSYGIGTGSAARTGNPARVTLSRTQLLINQRISQAAIRRVDAVQKWLDAGVRGTDICGGALGPEDLGGMSVRLGPAGALPPGPTPRALRVAATGQGDPSAITLSRGQLLINQRISQAAVRRSNALRQRLVTGLTGGDVVDGTITQAQIRLGVTIAAATPATAPPAASVTNVANPSPGNPAGVTLSRTQLLVNQRISQTAVRRSNALMAHIRTGLNGNDFRANTITAVDLAPGVVTG